MILLNPLLFFGFGLVIGSFLNVVILRYDPDRSIFSLVPIGGRSHCMSCGKNLSLYELIPLFSFLIQRGKCRGCGNRLSRQYPTVEFLAGLIFLTPFYFYNPAFESGPSLATGFFWTFIFLVFLVLSAIDYRLYMIPDELNILIAASGATRIFFENRYGYFSEFSGSFLQGYSALFGLRSDIWLNHLAGGVFGFFLIGTLILATKGKGMGIGDLKLMAALVILFGWPDALFLLSFGFIFGAVAGVFLMAFGRKGMKDSVPFGPFLVLGSIAMVFFGDAVLDWYFSLII